MQGWGVVAFLPITPPRPLLLLLLLLVKAQGLRPPVHLQPLVLHLPLLLLLLVNTLGGGMGLHLQVPLLPPFLDMQWMGLHTSLGV